MWIYGSGFPKSLDISKAIDKSLGAEREVIGEYQVSRDISKGSWQDLHCKPNNATMVNITKPATPQSKLWDGYGTAIKPAYEPVVLAMNPREGSFVNNALEHGCGGLNIDETRIGTGGEVLSCSKSAPFHAADGFQRTWNPTTGCGIDRVQHPVGRWPANILINDSPEVVGLFPDTNATKTQRNDNRQNRNNSMFIDGIHGPDNSYNDKGSAARFFYCAKAGRNEREIGCEEIDPIDRSIATGRKEGSAGLDNPRAMQRSTRPIRNNHPTVKPVQLMRYLLRLVTQPQHNMVLDPFGGSGTTGVACALDGIPAIVVELDKRHWEICCARIQWAVDLRRRLGRSPELDLSPYVQPSKLENGNGQGELF
jgi:site-specific DNA-methyltransferase (adenine-specific)